MEYWQSSLTEADKHNRPDTDTTVRDVLLIASTPVLAWVVFSVRAVVLALWR